MHPPILKEFLSNRLTAAELQKLGKSYDIIGDIAVIKIPSNLVYKKKLIAETVMSINKRVKTVLEQITPTSGEFRLRQVNYLCGEKKTETIHKEYGCFFKTDLAEVYFSPRLSYERMRITKIAQPEEIIINMFAGVGCFSILLAKHTKVKKIYSIDINPRAFQLMQENVILNKVEQKVEIIFGDSKEAIKRGLQSLANRVLMPLPEKAYEYLDEAVLAIKPDSGFIHYYDFVYARKGEKPIDIAIGKVGKKMAKMVKNYEIPSSKVVRTVGPNWHQIVLDIKVFI